MSIFAPQRPVFSSTQPNPPDWLLPAAVLLGIALLELWLYRIFAAANLYAGVGAMGPRAMAADLGTFCLILTGTLALILLIPTLARLVHHPALPSIVWRSIIVMIAPGYILVMMWSLWMRLSHSLVLFAIGASVLTVMVVAVMVLTLPLRRMLRFAVLAMPLMLLGATVAWTMLDLMEWDQNTRGGNMAIAARQVSDLLAIALPLVLTPPLLFKNWKDFAVKMRVMHLPALFVALVVVVGSAVLLLYSMRNAGQPLDLWQVSDFLRRVAYRTVGLTLWLRGGAATAMVSLFFLCFLITALVVPFRSWRTDAASRSVGLGLAFIYVAGLQPFAVYLLALSLLGYLMFFSGLIEKYATEVY